MSLVVTKLSVAYGTKTIIDDVSFEITQGSPLALIGENGSGKTTLLRALSGISLFVGSSKLNGSEYLLNKFDAAKLVSYCGDSSDLDTDLSVESVLRYSRYSRVDNRDLYLKIIKCFELDKLLSRKVNTLSGGERQRLNLACSLYQETNIVLWDEPTNYLDPRHIDDLEKIIDNFKQDKIFIMSSHDLNFLLNVSDEVLSLKDGKCLFKCTRDTLVEEQKFEEVFSKEFKYLCDSGTVLVK